METNRPYFSWSQYSLFKQSKYQFYKRYCLGEELNSKYLDKGKEFSEYRETGIVPAMVDDTLLHSVSKIIPELGNPEHEIQVDFIGDKPLICYLDDFKIENNKILFHEYKTGKVPWDKKKFYNHEQLDFYGVCIYLKYSIIPEVKLYWIETEDVEINGENIVRYTGYVKEFNKTWTEDELINFATKINLVLNEINSYVFNDIDIEDEVINRYIHINEEIEKFKSEKKLIELKILDDLKESGAEHAINKLGKFSISRRKTPVYSKELLTLEKKYKDEIDRQKAKEKKSPDIKYNVSESIRFTKNKKN